MNTEMHTTPELNAIICDLLRGSDHVQVRYAVARIEELEAENERLQGALKFWQRSEREQRWRALKAEAQLAALQARRCGTCEFGRRTCVCECGVTLYDEADIVAPKDFCCSLWRSREDAE